MKSTAPREHLPFLGRLGRSRRVPALRNALIVAMDRAVVVESASRYLEAGHSLKSVAIAMGIPLTNLWKWIGAARRSGPAGLVPGRWRSGRRKAPRNALAGPGSHRKPTPAPVTLPNEERGLSGQATRGGGHSDAAVQ